MLRRSIIALLLTSWLIPGVAHEETERYIPIGQSPGISGKYSYLGPIRSIDRAQQAVIVEDASGQRAVKVTPRTRIYLDRSASGLTNLTGSFEDCRIGYTVEIKYVDARTKDEADWIKVRVSEKP
jgi:hypothetical protein